MKLTAYLVSLAVLAGPAQSAVWSCSVPYDEVNGGGSITIEDRRMVFVSNWAHRQPETLTCARAGSTSECMTAALRPTRSGGASVFLKSYSIDWGQDGKPSGITVRQSSAIFRNQDGSADLSAAFPAIGYSFPVTDCEAQ